MNVLLYANLQPADLPADVRQPAGVGGHACEHQPLFVIVLAQDFVIAQIESVSYAEPVQIQKRNV